MSDILLHNIFSYRGLQNEDYTSQCTTPCTLTVFTSSCYFLFLLIGNSRGTAKATEKEKKKLSDPQREYLLAST